MSLRLSIICIGAACAVSSAAVAEPNRVATEVQVSSIGVDFSKPADAQAFYASLQRAAHKACTSQSGHNLAIEAQDRACETRSLDQAVRRLGQPSVIALHDKPGARPATVLASQ